MAQVQTVRGPVEAGDLGRMLMHEHVFVLTADVQQNYPDEWGDEDERVADAVRRLTRAAGARHLHHRRRHRHRPGQEHRRGSSGSPSRCPS